MKKDKIEKTLDGIDLKKVKKSELVDLLVKELEVKSKPSLSFFRARFR